MRESQSLGRTVVRVLLAAVLGTAALAIGVGADADQASAARVLAIGDIHGEYDGLVEILRELGVIDEENNWIGGKTTLVQTGDMVDRGPNVRKVLDLLMKLERQAEEQGGRLVVLLGNHEAMTLLGDYHDCTPEIFATFASLQSEQLRQQGLKEWTRWVRMLAQSRGGTAQKMTEEKRNEWMKDYPSGFFEYQQAFGLHGKYGQWLLERPVMFRVGDVLFQHAGISPEYAMLSIDEINDLHRKAIQTYLEDRESLAKARAVPSFLSLYDASNAIAFQMDNKPLDSYRNFKKQRLVEEASATFNSVQRIFLEDSPLWFRGYGTLPDGELQSLMNKLEEKHEARHFVVAHTPLKTGRIQQRLEGRVFLIDTGMLKSFYGGRPSALEIKDGEFTAVYVNDREVLLSSAPDLVPTTTSGSESSARWAPPAMPAISHGASKTPPLASEAPELARAR